MKLSKINLLETLNIARSKIDSLDSELLLSFVKKVERSYLVTHEKEIAKNDSNNALATSNRAQRDRLLAETDWMVTKALESGGALADNWKTYRQALRDITTHSNWPALKVPNMDGSGDNDWPVKPS